MLDVNSDQRILDGNVLNAGLATAVNRHSGGNPAPVNHAAAERIVTAHPTGVSRQLSAEADHGIARKPLGTCLDYGKIRKQKRHRIYRVGGGFQRRADEIGSVREEQGSIRICVNQFLQRFGYIGASVCFDGVGYDHIALLLGFGLILGSRCRLLFFGCILYHIGCSSLFGFGLRIEFGAGLRRV